MNLWVNRIGQLTALSVALFFLLSCQEEVSVLGYRNPNTKFKVYYYEIPLESSVLLRDSLRTSNYFYVNEPNRLLVGGYQDDRFGSVSATAVAQYFTTTFGKLPADAVYDSVSLHLQFDLYHYGAAGATPQTVSVYTLEDQILVENRRNYFNNTPATTGELLGSNSFRINPDDFDDFAASTTDFDTVITFRVPLKYAFGRELFAAAERWRDSDDELYVDDSLFVRTFKGLVIKPEATDKVVGFSPTANNTRLLLHYHTSTDTLALPLSFAGLANFNQIIGDRNGTEVAQVTEYHQEYLNDSETRYVQSGTGLLTKVDFRNFYSFIDSIPNLLVNSAELVVENVESGSLPPPPGFVLRNLNPSNNRFREYQLSNAQDSIDNNRYRGFFTFDFSTATSPAVIDDDFVYYVRGDKANSLAYSKSRSSYSGVFTLLVQQMTIRGDDRSQLTDFVLYPGSDVYTKPAFTSGAKSVNRAIFPRSGIKLRIYYTKPLNVQ